MAYLLILFPLVMAALAFAVPSHWMRLRPAWDPRAILD